MGFSTPKCFATCALRSHLTTDVIPAMLEEGYTFVRLDEVPEYRQYETPAPVAGDGFIRAASLDTATLK